MSRYRIHYLKEAQRQGFRNAPPAPGPLRLKRNHYQDGGEIEAASPYAAWKELQEASGRQPIVVGDALENDAGTLLLCRWAGFEEAHWYIPEPPPTPAPGPDPAGATQ